jgi:hypothetical protein
MVSRPPQFGSSPNSDIARQIMDATQKAKEGGSKSSTRRPSSRDRTTTSTATPQRRTSHITDAMETRRDSFEMSQRPVVDLTSRYNTTSQANPTHSSNPNNSSSNQSSQA